MSWFGLSMLGTDGKCNVLKGKEELGYVCNDHQFRQFGSCKKKYCKPSLLAYNLSVLQHKLQAFWVFLNEN